MSAEALTLPLARAASPARPVYFKVTRRVDIRLLGRWRQWAYEILCRKAPEAWRVPPIVPMERGGFDSFALADAHCTSRDDQIRVLPWNWASDPDALDPDVCCRPRDPADSGRYLRLREWYADERQYAEMARASEIDLRLERLKERIQTALAGG